MKFCCHRCLGAYIAMFHHYCVIKILHIYSNVIVYIVYPKFGCLATDSHDCKDKWCYLPPCPPFVYEHAL